MASTVLVVGASGFIGSQVIDRLRRRLPRTVGTYRSRQCVDPPCFKLDVGDLTPDQVEGYDVVVLCSGAAAGITSTDSLRAWEAVLERLARAVGSSRAVLVSTDAVFRHGGPYQPGSRVSPRTLYGEASALAEEALLAHPCAAVVRTSYVFGVTRLGMDRRVASLVAAARTGELFGAASDAYRSPTQVQHLAAEVERIALSPGIRGVVHAAGPRMTLYEHFTRLADALDLPADLVVKSRAEKLGIAERDTSLIGRATDELLRSRYSDWLADLAAAAGGRRRGAR